MRRVRRAVDVGASRTVSAALREQRSKHASVDQGITAGRIDRVAVGCELRYQFSVVFGGFRARGERAVIEGIIRTMGGR